MPLCQLDDIQMFYKVFVNEQEQETLDSNMPTMIVHHGGMGILDHQVELEAWKPFSKQVQLVFIDQRGCGQSENGDPSSWTMDQFGQDIYQFACKMDLEHPMFAGVSSGGYAGFACATSHPDFFTAMVLCNTELVVEPEAKKNAYLKLGQREDKREFVALQDFDDAEINKYAMTAAEAAYAYDIDPTSENYAKFAEFGFGVISKGEFNLTSPKRTNEAMKSKLANGYNQFDYTKKANEIQSPILWLAGAYDPLHPVECAEKGVRLLQNVSLNVLEAGAPVYLDAEDDFYTKVSAFLELQLHRDLSLIRRP